MRTWLASLALLAASGVLAPRTSAAQSGEPAPRPNVLAPVRLGATEPPAGSPRYLDYYPNNATWAGLDPRLMQLVRPLRVIYNGGPVPPNAHVELDVTRRLIVSGATVFGITWGLSVLTGSICALALGIGGANAAPCIVLMMPALGPAYTISTVANNTSMVFVSVLLALLAGGEAAGLAMMVAGVGTPQRVLVYDRLMTTRGAAEPRARRPAVRWHLAPTIPAPAAFGVAAGVTHF